MTEYVKWQEKHKSNCNNNNRNTDNGTYELFGASRLVEQAKMTLATMRRWL